jgi:para-nitrobenzyl esterase
VKQLLVNTTILALCAAVVACFSVAEGKERAVDRPRVTFEQGTIVGIALNDGEAFRGIPYAKPPVGDLRWRPPRMAERWKGARDGSSFGAICFQAARGDPNDESLARLPQSEDCLTLNIIRPRGVKKAPVMVWFHGGGNRYGAGSQAGYNVETYARHGIILVTVNYRLGNFGFFAHPAITAEAARQGEPGANFGLLDQVAALRWVQKNIAAFGGDPDRVTAFGESAGGSDILAIMSLPEAKSLFSAAIIESGGGTVLGALRDAEADGVKASNDLGLGASPTPAQLRAIPARELILAGAMAQTRSGFGAVVDGRLLKESPLSALRKAGLPVPLIIGFNSDEGAVLSLVNAKPDEVIKYLGGDRPAVREAYASLADKPDEFARTLFRDVKFAVPSRAVASVGTPSAPAWLYRFDYVPVARRAPGTGVTHSGELQYVFGVADQPYFGLDKPTRPVDLTSAERAVAAGISGCWAAFAKTRDPSSGAYCENWSPYGKARQMLIFDDTNSMQPLNTLRLDAIAAASDTTDRSRMPASSQPPADHTR